MSAKLYLLGFFGLSLYWYLQTVLQRGISLERAPRAILHHKLGAVKNLLVYIIAPYCEVVLWLITLLHVGMVFIRHLLYLSLFVIKKGVSTICMDYNSI